MSSESTAVDTTPGSGADTATDDPAGGTPREAPARRLRAEERRQQLFSVALRLFATRGYTATTMDDVAEAAGVTKPLLYHHFESKRALYLELVDAVSQQLITALAGAADVASGPRELVERGFAAYFRLMVHHEHAFRLLFGRDTPDDPELGEALRRVEQAITDAIEPLISADLEPAHRRLMAFAVVGMAEGASRHWLDTRRPLDPAAAMEGLTDTGADLLASSPEEIERSDHPSDEAGQLARRVSDLAWAGLRSIHRD